MSPCLKSGDTVLVNRIIYTFISPALGDVVVLKEPKNKRVIVKRITRKVKNAYFVEGDNKMHSTDSREFGMIEKSDIIGKVLI